MITFLAFFPRLLPFRLGESPTQRRNKFTQHPFSTSTHVLYFKLYHYRVNKQAEKKTVDGALTT